LGVRDECQYFERLYFFHSKKTHLTMNFKLNIWTLLFVGTLAAWGYTHQSAKPVAPAAPPTTTAVQSAAPSTCPVNSIPFSEGSSRTDAYTNAGTLITNPRFANGNVHAFILARCELQQMLAATGTTDSVVAQLAINPKSDQPGQLDTIDLVFRVFGPNTGSQGQFFDFSRPCPPMCKPKN
jgi:hypothetical protein